MFTRAVSRAQLCAFSFLLIATTALFGGRIALAENQSLCLSEATGCDIPGSTINVEVLLGAGDPTIVGVQFQLSYDAEALTPFEVLPGVECDAASPFVLEIHQEFDVEAGTLFYAVGVDTFQGGSGTNQPATVACVRFLPRGVSTSDICIEIGEHPSSTRMSDNMGHLVTVNNSIDCPAGSSEALSCKEAFVKDVCRCAEDADCETLTSPCCLGVCDSATALCTIMPINEGGACDDHNSCTTADFCQAGVCKGSGCTNQSLCFGSVCTPPGSVMVVPVLLGAGDPVITGAQFSVQWDPVGLDLLAVTPGSACDPDTPFVTEVGRIDIGPGELFYGVGIALGGTGTQGPETLACLFFNVLEREFSDVCLFEDINPFRTKLVDENGQFVDFYSDGSCSDPQGYPFIHCERDRFCEIPTMSEWGMAALALSLLICAKLRFRRTEAIA